MCGAVRALSSWGRTAPPAVAAPPSWQRSRVPPSRHVRARRLPSTCRTVRPSLPETQSPEPMPSRIAILCAAAAPAPLITLPWLRLPGAPSLDTPPPRMSGSRRHAPGQYGHRPNPTPNQLPLASGARRDRQRRPACAAAGRRGRRTRRARRRGWRGGAKPTRWLLTAAASYAPADPPRRAPSTTRRARPTAAARRRVSSVNCHAMGSLGSADSKSRWTAKRVRDVKKE